MKPATSELLAAVENQALRCGNERLALRALYLRTGNDDFIGDAELLVDIIEVESDHSARALKEAPEVIEREPAAMAALFAQDMVRSLELQLLAARRLAEFLEAGSKVGGAR